jgi:hypothetical protein
VGEFEQVRDWEARALQAQAKAAQACLRLVELTERSDTGQALGVARFLASTFNGDRYPLDLFELRMLDVPLSDDALICIDALRWGKADLYKLLPDGERRIADHHLGNRQAMTSSKSRAPLLTELATKMKYTPDLFDEACKPAAERVCELDEATRARPAGPKRFTPEQIDLQLKMFPQDRP